MSNHLDPIEPTRRSEGITPSSDPQEVGPIDNNQSTIEKSKRRAEVPPTDAAIPLLIPVSVQPSDHSYKVEASAAVAIAGITPNDLEKMRASTIAGIAKNLLDAWLENLKRIREYIEDDLKRREPIERAEHERIIQVSHGMERVIQDHLDKIDHLDPNAISSLPPLSTAYAVGVGFVGGEMMTITSHLVRAAESISSAMSGMLTAVATAVPTTDFRDVLGLLGALFANMNQINASVVPGAGRGARGEIDLNYARNYAKNVLQALRGSEIDSFLRGTLIARIEQTNPSMTEQQKKELISIVKIVLLSMALGMLYQAQHQWITREEFHTLAAGGMQFDDQDPLGQLYTQLAAMLNENKAQLSAPMQTKLINALAEYFNGRPDLRNLTNADTVFRDLYQFLIPQPSV